VVFFDYPEFFVIRAAGLHPLTDQCAAFLGEELSQTWLSSAPISAGFGEEAGMKISDARYPSQTVIFITGV
jgi:hypothetical protein